MKLIQTKDYLLLIDEEAEINQGDILYNEIFGVYESEANGAAKSHYKVVAYYPLTKEAKGLDLPLLPPFGEPDCWLFSAFKNEEDYSNNNPFYTKVFFNHSEMKLFSSNHSFENKSKHPQYCSTYSKHKTTNPKQFSLEDMKKAIEMARSGSNGLVTLKDFLTPDYSEEEIIQSLSTQQLPKEFVPEYEKDITNGWSNVLRGGDGKSKFKTKTNSEGKKVLVGTFGH